MRVGVILAFSAIIVALDVLASVRLLRAELITPAQKVAWLALTWLIPLLGAVLALQVSAERDKPAPVVGPYRPDSAGPEGWVSSDGGGFDLGGDGVSGHHGGH